LYAGIMAETVFAKLALALAADRSAGLALGS
jgi:hypothetical protein